MLYLYEYTKFQKFKVANKGPFVSTDRRTDRDDYNIPFAFLKMRIIRWLANNLITYDRFSFLDAFHFHNSTPPALNNLTGHIAFCLYVQPVRHTFLEIQCSPFITQLIITQISGLWMRVCDQKQVLVYQPKYICCGYSKEPSQ